MREKVLVVDDDLGLLRAVMRLLMNAGYEVEGAPGGHAALLMIETADYDLVLSDVDMPVIDGPELMDRAVASGRIDRSRFVFMTGAQTGAAMTLVRSGLQVVRKPFDTRFLLDVIGEALLTRAPRKVNVAG
jgi:two-component system NtrC family sensor kinase